MNLPIAFLLLIGLALCNAAALGRTWQNNKLRVRDDWSPINTTLTCLFLTSEPNWAGETQNLCQIGGICASQVPDGLAANVSSAGPSDGQTCFLYSEPNCDGTRSAPIVYPGLADLNTIGFDKMTMSWRCWKMCGYTIESSSAVSVSTVQPSVGPASSSANSSPSFTFLPTSTGAGGLRARQITTTLSSTEEGASITTTLSGSQPVVGTSSTTAADTSTSTSTSTTSAFTPPAPFSTITSSSTIVSAAEVTPTGPTSVDTTSFALASGSASSSTTIDTNTPGFSMSPSPVTVTHTFADGSKTTETTSVLEPVPTVPTKVAKMS